MTPAEVRDRLTHALRLDLIGPDPGEPQMSEILGIAPSPWYLTGFLVPWNAPASQKQDVENRGEGIFIGFKQEAMQSWLERPSVQAREQQLRNGFNAWAKAHPASSATFPGAAYVMLHALSHLLIADDDLAFITSANFTEWAQHRNVEAGVLIHDRQFTGRLRQQFDGLVQSRQVRRLPGF